MLQERPMTRPVHRASRPTVLVVEGESDLRALLDLALAGAGYRVIVAASHAEALRLLRAFHFDLVLTDSQAQSSLDADRWSGLTRLRAATDGTPMIICTAHAPVVFADYAARGFADLLPKPFDLDTLLAMVRAHVAPA
jgi:DNA-binding response OmpR family regulator